jgi:hypothetical protein
LRGRTERAHFSFGAGFGNSILSSADLPSERVEEQCGARIEGCGSGHDSRQPRTPFDRPFVRLRMYSGRGFDTAFVVSMILICPSTMVSYEMAFTPFGLLRPRPERSRRDATFRILAPKLKCSRELAATRQDRHSLLQ